MEVTSKIYVDIACPTPPEVVAAKQNDNDSRVILATLYDAGKPYVIPAGAAATFRASKPDGTGVFYDADVLTNGVVRIVLKEPVLAVAGQVNAEINLYNAQAQRLTSFTFNINVQESALCDEVIESSNYFDALTQTAAEILASRTGAADTFVTAPEDWQGAAAPYTLDVTVPGMTASKSLVVGLSPDASSAEYHACLTAGIMVTGQAVDKITLTAFMEKPNIPIHILIMERPVSQTGIDTTAVIPVAWSGAEPPYEQTISIPGMKGTEIVGLAETVTLAQYEAASAGQFIATGAPDELTIKAMGVKPTIEIPIRIKGD